MKNKIIGLSVITMALLSSSAYAGIIISDADVNDIVVEENKQFGFGGWNFFNVDVRIVNIADFSTALPGTNFDTLEGTYTPMGVDESFEADIKHHDGRVMGHLHGKDWPVGEPAGIKIINGDTKTSHGKPENCIMTSSYLPFQDMTDDTSGSGYLDAWAEGNMPNPVICSSGWQSHKRYKINLLPTTVENIDADGYGEPVDLLFNLDPEDVTTGITRYQVLQKANNYTGMRLDGYKVEVLDANGEKNPALTLSLGLGEGLDKDTGEPDGSDIWAESDMANFSHGLWGPYEEGRFDNGFFDYIRAYYAPALSDNDTTISYNGDMLGGNYQELFGNWLPSIWEPEGIFHDDDMDPATDGILKAFLGVAPGYTERAWYKSVVTYDPATPEILPVYEWLPATDEDLALWSGEWYTEGPVEDVLNLGLNYIINIGENAAIGDVFVLRITPHVAEDQTPPSSYNPDTMSLTYEFKDTADFNNDGIADILWRDTSDGSVAIWYMNADGTRSAEPVIGAVPENWSIKSAADFNDDGIADILWRNTSDGSVAIWYMNADGTRSAETVIAATSTTWVIQDAADFNNDGIADILWRSGGSVAIWYMNADGTISEGTEIGATSATWVIQEAADFNNDGIADILWKRGGSVAIWYMNDDGTRSAETLIGATSASWVIKSAADFNSDGIADILWRNTSDGSVAIWYMNADGTISDGTVIGATTASWIIEDAADFNNDGIADILWRNTSDGSIAIWYTEAV